MGVAELQCFEGGDNFPQGKQAAQSKNIPKSLGLERASKAAQTD
jgi:hypothetical protein